MSGNMKKVIAAGVLLFLAIGAIWAAGEGEPVIETKTSFGASNVQVVLNYSADEIDSEYVVFTGEEIGKIFDEIKKQTNQTSIPWTVLYNDEMTGDEILKKPIWRDKINCEEFEYKLYSISKGVITLKLVTDRIAETTNKSNKIEFPGFLLGQKQDFQVLFVQFYKKALDGNVEYRLYYYTGKVQNEFFNGENILFNDIKDSLLINYITKDNNIDTNEEKRKLYFLKTMIFMSYVLFKDDVINRTYFEKYVSESILAELGGSPTNNILKSLRAEILYPDIKWFDQNDPSKKIYQEYISSFKDRMTANFIASEEILSYKTVSGVKANFNMPLIDFSENVFDRLYGDGKIKRHPYIYAYLLFCYKEEYENGKLFRLAKPVLSYMINEALQNPKKENGQIFGATEKPNIPYNSFCYTPVTEGEGTKIANAALRYLTWGVEFTPNTPAPMLRIRGTNKLIMGTNDNLPLIKSWIDNSSNTGRMQNLNYLPAGTTIGTANDTNFIQPGISIPTTHILEGAVKNNTIGIFGMLKNGKSFNISRVDVWTAINIAWKENIISSYILNGKLNPGSGQMLNDRSRDAAIAFQPLEAQNEMSIGYTFNGIQTIRSLLVSGNFLQGDKKGPPSIEILVNGIKHAYTYLVTSSTDQKYIPVKNMNSTFSNNTEYHYFILTPKIINGQPELIKASSISIKYYNYSTVNINELLVFNENPIKYLDLNRSTSTSMSEIFKMRAESDSIRDISSKFYFNQDTKKSISYRGIGISLGKQFSIWPTIGICCTETRNTFFEKYQSLLHGEKIEIYGEPKYPNVIPDKIDPNVGYTQNAGEAEEWYLSRHTLSGVEGYSVYKDYNKATISDANLKVLYYNFKPEVLYIKILFNSIQEIQSVVVWEDSGLTGVTNLDSELIIFDEMNDSLLDNIISGKIDLEHIQNFQREFDISTPFKSSQSFTNGNPLPYTPMGIDSPRTFAYKMFEQVLAQQWVKSDGGTLRATTIAGLNPDSASSLAIISNVYNNNVENYNEGYVNEIDVYKVIDKNLKIDESTFNYASYNSYIPGIALFNDDYRVKPFLPGQWVSSGKGFINSIYSPFQPDKSAGVDSLGILMGSLSVSGVKGIFNAFNQDISISLDSYYRMDKPGTDEIQAKGLDEKGLPAFYGFNGNSFLDGNYRFKNADIERSTIIVPDISEIQKGDLLVKYNNNGEPHIGIVVGIAWKMDTSLPAPTWGSPAEEWWDQIYVVSIHAGLQHVMLGTWGAEQGSTSFNGFTDQPKTYQIRRLLKYFPGSNLAEEYDLPVWECVKKLDQFNYTEYPSSDEIPLSALYMTDMNSDSDVIKYIKTTIGKYYYRELPGTHFSNQFLDRKIIDNDMIISNYTGWRWSKKFSNPIYPYFVSYHKALDFGASIGTKIFAPEDGCYFYLDNSLFKNQKIPIGASIKELSASDSYSPGGYGYLLIFITNPELPEKGRIYVFCHIGTDDKGSFTETRTMIEAEGIRFVTSFEDAIKKEGGTIVKKGAIIGLTGDRGLGGAHLHLEVFECFNKVSGLSGSYHWRSIDPKSLWINGILGVGTGPEYEDFWDIFNETDKLRYFKDLGIMK